MLFLHGRLQSRHLDPHELSDAAAESDPSCERFPSWV